MVSAKTVAPEGVSNVRFGSKADMCSAQAHDRFAPNATSNATYGNVRFGHKQTLFR
jgi:hypothetical protein